MPIRFRCAYCNQLMGIARRKAGSVVRCPKCAGEIIVPVPDGAAGADEESAPPAGGLAFDVEKFDPAFPEPINTSTGAVTIPSVPAPAPIEAAATPIPGQPPAAPQRLGVFVPLGMLIISIGVVVLLLILLFVIGLIIGRATMISPEAASTYQGAAHAVNSRESSLLPPGVHGEREKNRRKRQAKTIGPIGWHTIPIV